MRNSDFAFISSALGSVALPLLLIVFFDLLGTESLWQPMTSGGQEVNARYLIWIVASIPAGAFLACWVNCKQFKRPVSWLKLLLISCGGCVAGFIFLYNLSVLLVPPLILPVCCGGLLFIGVFYFAALRKQKQGPTYIKLPL